jgi:hypothetical protein
MDVLFHHRKVVMTEANAEYVNLRRRYATAALIPERVMLAL